MKVYLVKLDWSTEDSNDVELTVYPRLCFPQAVRRKY